LTSGPNGDESRDLLEPRTSRAAAFDVSPGEDLADTRCEGLLLLKRELVHQGAVAEPYARRVRRPTTWCWEPMAARPSGHQPEQSTTCTAPYLGHRTHRGGMRGGEAVYTASADCIGTRKSTADDPVFNPPG
jgi:hypothetical protein